MVCQRYTQLPDAECFLKAICIILKLWATASHLQLRLILSLPYLEGWTSSVALKTHLFVVQSQQCWDVLCSLGFALGGYFFSVRQNMFSILSTGQLTALQECEAFSPCKAPKAAASSARYVTDKRLLSSASRYVGSTSPLDSIGVWLP